MYVKTSVLKGGNGDVREDVYVYVCVAVSNGRVMI